MSYLYYAPRIIYGFKEKSNDGRIINDDFLEKYNISFLPSYTSKGVCYDFIYGIVCNSFDNMESININIVHDAFEAASFKFQYNTPAFLLGLGGDFNLDKSKYTFYNPEE
jgi:hypothetical protein